MTTVPEQTPQCHHGDTADPGYNLWDADPHTRLYLNERLRYATLQNLAPPPPGTVLDVGCGTGFLSCLLQKDGYEVTALDLSQERLEVFAACARRLEIRQVAGDFFATPLEPVDLLVAQEILVHLPDPRTALKRFKELVKPGGTALFSVPYAENLEARMITCPHCGQRYHRNGHLHSFTRTSFRKLLAESGWQVETLRLLVNKRLVKWNTALGAPFGPWLLPLDSLMNTMFPQKAAYLAAVVHP